MSTVERRKVISSRIEYVVPSPAAFVEVQKAIAMALNEMPEDRRPYDDACTVEARDDEIVVWWPEEDA